MRKTGLALLNIIPPKEALERIKTDCGVKVEYYNGDVTNRQEVKPIIETFHRMCGSVDMRLESKVLTQAVYIRQASRQTSLSWTTSDKNFSSTFAFKVSLVRLKSRCSTVMRSLTLLQVHRLLPRSASVRQCNCLPTATVPFPDQDSTLSTGIIATHISTTV